jgi:phosphoribosylanthranilate isomerase
LTRVDDALCAVEAGADMLGFIFYPPSPRGVSPTVAADIIRQARATRPGICCVGVFVNESPAQLQVLRDALGLDLIQLSGNETVETLHTLPPIAYKAVRRADEVAAYLPYAHQLHPLRPDILLEADHPTLYGGTGQLADASLAAQLAQRHRVLLAGGLTPDNVATAIQTARPWGVDVASGVEASKGVKDHAKIRAFICAARDA